MYFGFLKRVPVVKTLASELLLLFQRILLVKCVDKGGTWCVNVVHEVALSILKSVSFFTSLKFKMLL